MREKYKIPWQYIIGELEWDEKNIFTEKNENQEKEVNKIIKLHREETVQYEEGKKKKKHTKQYAQRPYRVKEYDGLKELKSQAIWNMMWGVVCRGGYSSRWGQKNRSY